ncbi:hypothetical protein SBRCBS47491_006196 [Sporothrix bragantina]|uniref:Uncharacterized protein n=1 Tax=Sporothrix bragantina TaxID=671064 RepID=A0ABP0C3V2_9PEZI
MSDGPAAGPAPASAPVTIQPLSSSSPFTCTVCRKTYKRREHLQRHFLSHAPVPAHRCSICGSSYRRPDVLKRHFATCQQRRRLSTSTTNNTGGAASLPSLKRKACDRCVQYKKGCSTGQPCANCRAKGVACRYSFAKEAIEVPETLEPSWTGVRDNDNCEDDGDDGDDGDDDNDDNQGSTNDGSTDDGGYLTAEITIVNPDINLDSNSDISSEIPIPPSLPMMELTQTHPSPFAYLDENAVEFLLDSSNSQKHMHSASWLDFLNLTTDGNVLARKAIAGDDNDNDHASNPTSQNHNPNQHQNQNQSQLLTCYTFHFLDNFTKKTGLVTFDCGTTLQASQVVDALARENSRESFPPLQPLPQLQDPLIVKTHQILFRIREVATVKPRNSTVMLSWSAALEQQCLQFFSPPNLHKFLALYWARWHPNVNIVHRPTFDPVDAKCVLVVAMALIGACMSPDADDNRQACLWFNCVEEIVFIDDDFCGRPNGNGNPTGSSSLSFPATFDPVTNKRKIQALQASYLVCLYQNWEGTDESKQRIRRYRFSTVVSVARDIGIGSARHVDYGACTPFPFLDFHWNAFVAREQLIRTFLWIYLLDQAFVIFNNLPPRVMIKEMVMHMAWPESVFQATTAADCAQEVQLWLARSAPTLNMTLREIVEAFCSGVLAPDVCRYFADLGPLNLFCIVSAFHFLIFQKQNSFGGEDQLLAIRTGLANWKTVWEIHKREFSTGPPHTMVPIPLPNQDDTTAPDDMWRRTGFMRHSPEYWLLAHLVIDRLSSQQQEAANRNLYTSMHHTGMHAFDNTARDPILAKYDETSMRQVNDLISQLRNVQLM